VHSRIIQYSCDVCNVLFSDQGALKVHQCSRSKKRV
jgi:hypothetical protein